MSTPVRSNSLQTYQVILYPRALHPELFSLKGRRVFRRAGCELEAWLMAGAHVLRYEHAGVCATELVTDQEGNLPELGALTRFLCAGERDFEHRFTKNKLTYMTTVQTETLSENVYHATHRELLEMARESGSSLVHRWADEAGECLSIVDVQMFTGEVHVQAYHMLAMGGVVLRTQSLFEHEKE